MDGSFLNDLVALFLTLGGFAAFITFVVNILKRFGVIPDGSADMWVKYLNLAGLVVVGILSFVVPDAIPVVDNVLGLLAQLGGILLPILAVLLGWPVANAISGFTYGKTKNVPLLGYSHSKG